MVKFNTGIYAAIYGNAPEPNDVARWQFACVYTTTLSEPDKRTGTQMIVMPEAMPYKSATQSLRRRFAKDGSLIVDRTVIVIGQERPKAHLRRAELSPAQEVK